MARKALLIGCETGVLKGVGNDVAAMAATLGRWDFTITRCEGENATRAGVIDAYELLIAQTRFDDAVVVYYSGHGGYAPDPELGYGMPSPRVIQFIVPADYPESSDEDFRGITSPELSLLLQRLTERTGNVAVVLDCCHAAHMSRDPDRAVRSLPRKVSVDIVRAHLDSLALASSPLRSWRPQGNPNAVRIVACAPEQAAYEADNSDSRRMGYLTDALTRTLDELRDSGLTLSWATVADRVRQRVLMVYPGQRPEAEGPATRVVFETAEADPVGSLPAVGVRDRVRIAGAAFFGARVGDEYTVVPTGSPAAEEATPLGVVRVDRVDGQDASGPLPGVTLPLGARAHLTTTALPAMSVRLDREEAGLAGLVARDPLLCQPEPDDDGVVRVAVEPTGLVIHDGIGPLHVPRPVDPSGAATVLIDLRRIARARALRRLSEDPGSALGAAVAVRFAKVESGIPVPLPGSGAVLRPGDAVCVTVRNEWRDPVYVSLVDIGVSARITVLNPAAPSGVRIEPGKEYTFGGNDLLGGLAGMELGWPESVPGERAREETIMVLASDGSVDTRVMEQQGLRGMERPSRLERFLSQLGEGSGREVAPMLLRPAHFAVHTIDFELAPGPAPAAERAAFQVRDFPALAGTARTEGPSARVVVRLADLVAHHDRMFRHLDIRLDALVLTADGDGRQRAHQHTARFAEVGDGKRLPLDPTPLFDGTARANVDIAVWISPDRPGVPGLAALLHGMDPAVSAGEAVDRAHSLLLDACGVTMGLYRGSFLAAERFGADRPPVESVVRASDFSCRVAIAISDGPSVEQ
ncbi:caspase family protein [Actinokineospora sp. 24-640]